jgi:signal transduction histidine kinase
MTILVRDTNGTYLFANEQAYVRIGRNPDEVPFTSVHDIYPEELAQQLLEQDRAVARSGLARTFEADLPMPDGSVRSYLLAKYPVVPRPGLPTLVATVATDITEQRALAGALHESELRFRQLTDSIEDVFSLATVFPSEPLYVSPNAADVYGVPEEEADADPGALLRNVQPDDLRVVLAMLDDVVRRQVGSEVVYRVLHPTRGLRWMRGRARPVSGPGGDRRIAMVANDVTADRQLEAELVRARDVAEEANARKDEFLSQMSHELRTPLNAILGFSQLLELDESRLDPDHLDHVRQIRRAGQHLLDLITDILDMSRIDRGAIALSTEAVDVASLATDVCKLLVVRAEAQAVTLAVTDDGAPDGPALVLADRQRLKQVLINLIDNAIKYNRPGGRVEVSCRAAAGRMHIEIADTGPGLSAADIERLFTPFERLNHVAAVEGTGIGLALSRQLVRAMGGTISVESEVKVGTTFKVELPSAPRATSG